MSWRPEDWESWIAPQQSTARQPLLHADWLHEILLRIPGRERMTLADLGCGTRAPLGFLSAQFGRVVVVEQVAAALAEVRATCDAQDVSFWHRDLNELSEFAGTFDVALALSSIRARTTTEIDRILTQIHNSLVEGGLLVATVPASTHIGGPIRLRLSSDESALEQRNFHEVELQYRLQRAGFQGVRIRRSKDAETEQATLLCMAVRRANN